MTCTLEAVTGPGPVGEFELLELLQPATPQAPEVVDRLFLDTISYSETGDVQLGPEQALAYVRSRNYREFDATAAVG